MSRWFFENQQPNPQERAGIQLRRGPADAAQPLGRIVRRYSNDDRIIGAAKEPYFWRETGSMGEEVEPTWLERANEYGRARLAEQFLAARRNGAAVVTWFDGERIRSRIVGPDELYLP